MKINASQKLVKENEDQHIFERLGNRPSMVDVAVLLWKTTEVP